MDKRASRCFVRSCQSFIAFVLFSLGLTIGPVQPQEPQKPSAQAINSKTKSVIVFHQKTATMGNADFFLADDAACLILHNGDNIAIAKAPSWDIVLFSKQKNLGYSITMAKIKGDHMGLFRAPLNLSLGKISACKGQHFGFKGQQIIAQENKNQTVEKDAFIFQDAAKPKVVKDVFFCCADVGKLDPRCHRFIQWVYSEIQLPGMPLELTTHYMDGSHMSHYETVSVEKTTRPDSFFVYPSGFKKSSTKLRVLASADAQSTLEDLFGSVKDK